MQWQRTETPAGPSRRGSPPSTCVFHPFPIPIRTPSSAPARKAGLGSIINCGLFLVTLQRPVLCAGNKRLFHGAPFSRRETSQLSQQQQWCVWGGGQRKWSLWEVCVRWSQGARPVCKANTAPSADVNVSVSERLSACRGEPGPINPLFEKDSSGQWWEELA